MTEANLFYINVYNLFITLNQSVDMITQELNIDLPYGQYTLLKFISTQEENRITQKRLDEWSSLRKPSISQILKILNKKGYILHFSMNEDIRCKEIMLTKKAIDSVKQIDLKMTELLSNRMTKEDIAFYVQFLNSAKEIMER